MKTKTKQNKNEKNKEIITQSICQKKIEERHLIESLVCRQPRAIRYPPDRNYLAFAPKGVASTTPYSQGFRLLYRHSRRRLGSLSLGRSNPRGSKTSQVCYSHLRCNLNLVRFFRFSLPLPVFGRLFLFLRPRVVSTISTNTSVSRVFGNIVAPCSCWLISDFLLLPVSLCPTIQSNLTFFCTVLKLSQHAEAVIPSKRRGLIWYDPWELLAGARETEGAIVSMHAKA